MYALGGRNATPRLADEAGAFTTEGPHHSNGCHLGLRLVAAKATRSASRLVQLSAALKGSLRADVQAVATSRTDRSVRGMRNLGTPHTRLRPNGRSAQPI